MLQKLVPYNLSLLEASINIRNSRDCKVLVKFFFVNMLIGIIKYDTFISYYVVIFFSTGGNQ